MTNKSRIINNSRKYMPNWSEVEYSMNRYYSIRNLINNFSRSEKSISSVKNDYRKNKYDLKRKKTI